MFEHSSFAVQPPYRRYHIHLCEVGGSTVTVNSSPPSIEECEAKKSASCQPPVSTCAAGRAACK